MGEHLLLYRAFSVYHLPLESLLTKRLLLALTPNVTLYAGVHFFLNPIRKKSALPNLTRVKILASHPDGVTLFKYPLF